MRNKKSYIERDFEEMFKGSNTEYLVLMMREKLVKMMSENSNVSRKKDGSFKRINITCNCRI